MANKKRAIWQTEILERLKKEEYFYAADLLSAGWKHTEYAGLRGAVAELRNKKKVEIYRASSGLRRVVIGRLGAPAPANTVSLNGRKAAKKRSDTFLKIEEIKRQCDHARRRCDAARYGGVSDLLDTAIATLIDIRAGIENLEQTQTGSIGAER